MLSVFWSFTDIGSIWTTSASNYNLLLTSWLLRLSGYDPCTFAFHENILRLFMPLMNERMRPWLRRHGPLFYSSQDCRPSHMRGPLFYRPIRDI